VATGSVRMRTDGSRRCNYLEVTVDYCVHSTYFDNGL
jgi:hypothetical protein